MSTADASPPDSAAAKEGTVAIAGHHHSARRTGAYVQPGLSRTAISTLHRDTSFDGTFTGKVYAQPLFAPGVGGGTGTFYVVTASNDLLAFDEKTGSIVWRRNFGPPADNENAACEFPTVPGIGITGTPAIDLTAQTLYLDAVQSVGDAGNRFTATHLIHAVSLVDGSERVGWPVDPKGLSSNGHVFDPTVQHQRGALLLAGGMLYVPYGSLGDCGDYQGWVVGVSVLDPSQKSAYATPGGGAGIWGPSGVAADQGSIFVATGNGHAPAAWAGGEAVLRFPAGVALTDTPSDFYAPANWQTLDQGDLDVGGSGVLLLDLPHSTPSALALALGKDGFAYLLDQNHLGGMGDGGPEGVAKVQVATGDIVTAPAAYTTKDGTFVALDAQNNALGTSCPEGQSGNLIVLRIVEGAPPTIQTAWCVHTWGHGSPIVTTTDGTSDPIVWATSNESNQLHAFDGESGAVLFDGGDLSQQLLGAARFNTLIAIHDRIVVAADNRLYAFAR